MLPAQNAIAEPDSLYKRKTISLDLVPLYYNFFDTRVQGRIAFDYSIPLKKNFFFSHYSDLGLFDSYTFNKYYDFFNQSGGMYFYCEKVSIIGIHQMPSFNYFLFNKRKGFVNGLYGGTIMDLTIYQKKRSSFNSRTNAEFADLYYQARLSAGLSGGIRYFFLKHFIAEVNTAFFAAVLNYADDKKSRIMPALAAQWTSRDYRFWWNSKIKIGYVF